MSESTRYTCKKCSDVFRADRWAECSNCGERVPAEIRSKYENHEDEKVSRWQELLDVSKNEGSVTSVASPYREPSREISVDAKAIINSQNRTTHAVRALTIFTINIFTFTLVGALCIWFGIALDQVWLMIFGSAFTFAGIGGSIQLSLRELRKSDR